jgi:hypothetical protein
MMARDEGSREEADSMERMVDATEKIEKFVKRDSEPRA